MSGVTPEDLKQRYNESISRFSADMRKKLHRNIHKAHWGSCSLDYLVRRLREEVEELTQAYDRAEYGDMPDEAADVANIAMMISEAAKLRARAKSLADTP